MMARGSMLLMVWSVLASGAGELPVIGKLRELFRVDQVVVEGGGEG